MDYYFRGRVEIRNPSELAQLLEFQKGIKTITLKRGTILRTVSTEKTLDIFNLNLRTHNPVEIRKLYTGLRELLTNANLTGSAQWHECRHEDVDEPCFWNESFQHTRSGGDT